MSAADIAVPVAAAMVGPTMVSHGHMTATARKVPRSTKVCAAAEMTTTGMAAAEGVTTASRMAATAAASRMAASAAAVALRQCRSRARQNES